MGLEENEHWKTEVWGVVAAVVDYVSLLLNHKEISKNGRSIVSG